MLIKTGYFQFQPDSAALPLGIDDLHGCCKIHDIKTLIQAFRQVGIKNVYRQTTFARIDRNIGSYPYRG